MRNVRKKGNVIKFYSRDRHLTFTLGNRKLGDNVLIFNVPAGITCIQRCPGCYALKAERIYPSVRQSRHNNLETLKNDPAGPGMLSMAIYNILEYCKIKGIRVDAIRIHESGDFYSPEYFQAWKRAAKVAYSHGVRTHTYTKTGYSTEDSDGYINIIESILPDGSLNYGSRDYIDDKKSKYGGQICPHGILPNITCGKDCTVCYYERRVLFLEH